ncbi:MAG: type I restriction-modification enzyme R subunit C-terminal domain-containing protein [Thermoguttaceae bacterium]|jgi:type I restriction enzyme R subunit
MSRSRSPTAEQVRTLYTSAADLRDAWANPEDRAAVIEALRDRGIDFDELAESAHQPDADPFDLLCHIAYNAPLRTRRERARRLRTERRDFWDQYSPEARAILDELLEKHAAHGAAQFVMPDVLEVPPINGHGNVREIAEKFGGEGRLAEAAGRLQMLLYQ